MRSEILNRFYFIIRGTIIAIAATLLTLSTSCRREDRKEDRRADQIIELIDERRYEEAIDYLENQVAAGEREKFAAYLAQAHLGLAGFEPLRFAVSVSERQSLETEEARRLQNIFKDCNPTDQLRGSGDQAVRCIMWRLFLHAPDESDAHLSRARLVFRESFADPSTSSAGINALAGATEAVSMFSAFKKAVLLYVEIRPENISEEQILELVRLAGLAAEYSKEVLRRARATSYFGISKRLTNLEDEWLIKRTGFDLEFFEETALPLLIEFSKTFQKTSLRHTKEERELVHRLFSKILAKLLGASPPVSG